MSDVEYEFEYSDEEEEEEDVDVENAYYTSKALAETNMPEALEGLEKVLNMESTRGEWGFKALKQMVKILFRQQQFDLMMKRYHEFLACMNVVTRNFSEQSINSILDLVSMSQNMEILQRFYEATLEALRKAKNERLWFKTNLKLAKLYFDTKEYPKLQKILRELHRSCQEPDGTDDQKKGTQLLEVYALEIQLCTETKNHKKLQELYDRSLKVKSAIPHPRIMAVIRECGGKMHMRQREWDKACTDFFEAFKNYDEAGSHRPRIQCLKYLVLANMLRESEINPFDSQEAKPYKNDPEIVAMTNLVSAYMRGEINEFEKILRENKATIMDDPFIRFYMEDLLKNIRTQVLLKLVAPYTRVRYQFIAENLNVTTEEVEALLVSLVLDNKVKGKLDQLNHLLLLQKSTDDKYAALEKWTEHLSTLHDSVLKAL